MSDKLEQLRLKAIEGLAYIGQSCPLCGTKITSVDLIGDGFYCSKCGADLKDPQEIPRTTVALESGERKVFYGKKGEAVATELLGKQLRLDVAAKLRAKHMVRQLMWEAQDVTMQQANLYNDIKDCLPNGDVLLTLANLIDPAEQESTDGRYQLPFTY